MAKCTITFEDSPDGRGLLFGVKNEPPPAKPEDMTLAQQIGGHVARQAHDMLEAAKQRHDSPSAGPEPVEPEPAVDETPPVPD